ncbi:hypothetical protein C2G38_2249683 [Gigaspora rosea]|uniref:Zn(2)-C6 fungal-type domain-containing protein n=1 Tax=Gigaspora rosea TaxID=44941 RepID=A0A397UPP3_9GLOM|nr:hypothetical protein C2G38_2249683 [Gigaspora rosea]
MDSLPYFERFKYPTNFKNGFPDYQGQIDPYFPDNGSDHIDKQFEVVLDGSENTYVVVTIPTDPPSVSIRQQGLTSVDVIYTPTPPLSSTKSSSAVTVSFKPSPTTEGTEIGDGYAQFFNEQIKAGTQFTISASDVPTPNLPDEYEIGVTIEACEEQAIKRAKIDELIYYHQTQIAVLKKEKKKLEKIENKNMKGTACDNCRKRKRRCDRSTIDGEPCGYCGRNNKVCSHLNK